MADYNHSKVLFTAEDGSSLQFYMVPCAERKELKPLIEHGGGLISNQQPQESIRLLPNGTEAQSNGMVKSSYVWDCVKANRLLNLSPYRMCKGESVVTDIDFAPADRYIIKVQSKDRRGRAQYLLDEQQAMLRYLLDEMMYMETKGNAVWKTMARKQVTKHTWQSMKDHFHKIMLPKIHTFNLSRAEVAKFTGDFTSLVDDDDDVQKDNNANVKAPRQMSCQDSPPKRRVTSSPSSISPARSAVRVLRADKAELDISDVDEFDAELLKSAEIPVLRRSPRAAMSKRNASPKTRTEKDSHSGKQKTAAVDPTPRKRVKKNLEETTLSEKVLSCSIKDKAQSNMSSNNSQGDGKDGKGKGISHKPNLAKNRGQGSGDSPVRGRNRNRKYSPGAVRAVKRRVLEESVSKESVSEESVSEECVSEDQPVGPRHTLRDFVMLDTQPDASDKPEEEEEEDDEEEDPPEDMEKVSATITRVCRWLEVDYAELLDAVHRTSGSLKQAVKYIVLGKTDEGKHVWEPSDDEILQTGTEEDLEDLDIRFGSQEVLDRQQFLAQYGEH